MVPRVSGEGSWEERQGMEDGRRREGDKSGFTEGVLHPLTYHQLHRFLSAHVLYTTGKGIEE